MIKKVMDIKLNYSFEDNNSEKTIVLLHGWGQNIEMMKPLGNELININKLYIDFPGFGKSSEPNYSWSVYNYAKCLNILIEDLKIKDVIIIGHSFGGRIGLIYASMYKVDKLICLASPFCKELTKIPLKTKVYKKVKKIPGLKWLANIIKKYVGSTDYNNASPIMRGVMVSSINLDMIQDIKKIQCDTLLIWGSLDTAVPIERAYELQELIKNSKVIVYPKGTHYAYLEYLKEVKEEINKFIEE